MASVTDQNPNPPDEDSHSSMVEERVAEREKLRISRFDIVTSFFMALILFIGTFVTILFIIWLTSRWSFPPRPIEPIIENPAGRGENPEGFERDFEPPGAEEVEELMEPTLQDTIEAVTDAVSSVAASLVTTDTAATATTAGTGAGDSRPPGPPGASARPRAICSPSASARARRAYGDHVVTAMAIIAFSSPGPSAETKASAIGKLKALGLNDAEIASITGG